MSHTHRHKHSPIAEKDGRPSAACVGRGNEGPPSELRLSAVAATIRQLGFGPASALGLLQRLCPELAHDPDVQPQLPPPKLNVREHTPRQQVSTEEQSGTPEPLPPADGDSLAGPSVSGSAVFIQPMVAQLEWPEVMASTFDWGPRDF